VPSTLSRAADLYDRALRGYEQAVDAFVAASFHPAGADLNAAMASAIDVAKAADAVYEQARAVVAREWKRLGLPETQKP
jgi:hypothetical protein